MNNIDLEEYARGIPKCELHIHIEGALESSLMLEFAHRNNLKLRNLDKKAADAIYHFEDLQSFLDIYYESAAVLIQEDDFYELGMSYFKKAASNNVRHAEIMFDPQMHTERGVPFLNCLKGLKRAQADAETSLNITSKLIMSFMRHLPIEKHFDTLEEAKPYIHLIDAIGLDSTEIGYENKYFAKLFEKVKELGVHVVAHAGEEGMASNITDSLELLKVERIDHGVTCTQDPQLLKRLIDEQVTLTCCPISNYKLKVFPSVSDHSILKVGGDQLPDLDTMLSTLTPTTITPQVPNIINYGLKVCINSDDPAYFGGYITDNFIACIRADLNWTYETVLRVVLNSIEGSFLDPQQKKALTNQVLSYHTNFVECN